MWEGGRYIINEPNCCSTCRREDVTLRKQTEPTVVVWWGDGELDGFTSCCRACLSNNLPPPVLTIPLGRINSYRVQMTINLFTLI